MAQNAFTGEDTACSSQTYQPPTGGDARLFLLPALCVYSHTLAGADRGSARGGLQLHAGTARHGTRGSRRVPHRWEMCVGLPCCGPFHYVLSVPASITFQKLAEPLQFNWCWHLLKQCLEARGSLSALPCLSEAACIRPPCSPWCRAGPCTLHSHLCLYRVPLQGPLLNAQQAALNRDFDYLGFEGL